MRAAQAARRIARLVRTGAQAGCGLRREGTANERVVHHKKVKTAGMKARGSLLEEFVVICQRPKIILSKYFCDAHLSHQVRVVLWQVQEFVRTG